MGATPRSSGRETELRSSLRAAERLATTLRSGDPTRHARRAARLRTALLDGAEKIAARDPVLASTASLAALAIDPSEDERTRGYAIAERAATALEPGHAAAEAWLALGTNAWAAGRATRAISAVERAQQLAIDAPTRVRARVHLELGRIAFGRTELASARRHTEIVRELAAERDLDLEALAHIGLAAIGSHELASDAARHARRAILLAERIGARDLLARAQAQLGIVLVERGVHDEGRAVLESAIEIERERAVDENECRALLYLSMLEVDAGRPLHALRILARARQVAERRGSRVARGMVLGSIGIVHLVRGHPRPAARAIAQAELILEDVGNRHARITFSAFLGAAEALAHQPIESRAAFEQARTLMEAGGGPPYARELVRVLECVLAITEGDPTSARETLAEVERGAVVAHWADLRVGCRLVRSALLGDATTKLPRTEPTAGLVIAHDARWFSLEGSAPIDLERRPVLRATLAALADARSRSPGATVPREHLVRALWPQDERLPAALLVNRVNVAIATLRRLGLRGAITTGERGYRLREDLAVTIDPG